MRNKFSVFLEDNEFEFGNYKVTLGKVERIAFEFGVELQYEEDAKYYLNGIEIDEIPNGIHEMIKKFINNQQSIY